MNSGHSLPGQLNRRVEFELSFYNLQGKAFLLVLWTELGPSSNSCTEALTPSMAMFGDRAFKRVIKSN